MSYVLGDILMGKSPDYADLASKSERQRQALIDLGMQQINAVFSGGSAPFYTKATGPFNPKTSYFGFDDKGFSPYYDPATGGHGLEPVTGYNVNTGANGEIQGAKLGAAAGSVVPGIGTVVGASLGGTIGAAKSGDYGSAALSTATGGGSSLLKGLFQGHVETPQEKLAKLEKKGLLFERSDPSFQGFGPDFYDKRAQAYVDFAMPQLAKQYRDTRDTIGFGLANRGLRGSGTAQSQFSNLARTNASAVQGISDAGRSQAQALQRQIEDERNTLINQLYQSADPARGVQAAISAASNFAQPSTFAPLANSFAGLINQYYTSQLLNPKQGTYVPPSFGGGLNTGALPGNYSVG